MPITLIPADWKRPGHHPRERAARYAASKGVTQIEEIRAATVREAHGLARARIQESGPAAIACVRYLTGCGRVCECYCLPGNDPWMHVRDAGNGGLLGKFWLGGE